MLTLYLRRRRERSGKPGVEVRTYKGNRALQRGLQHMLSLGYEVRQQATRKAAYSALAGVFTRKQIHTVTYVR